MKTSRSQKLFAGLAIAGVLALAGCATSAGPGQDGYPGGSYSGDKTGCVVSDKQAIGRSDSDGGSSTDYRVFTENCGTFGVQDDPIIGQWNSADTYGSIKVGETYDFEAYGWRNGFYSTFPNIKTAYPAESAESEK